MNGPWNQISYHFESTKRWKNQKSIFNKIYLETSHNHHIVPLLEESQTLSVNEFKAENSRFSILASSWQSHSIWFLQSTSNCIIKPFAELQGRQCFGQHDSKWTNFNTKIYLYNFSVYILLKCLSYLGTISIGLVMVWIYYLLFN